MMKKHILFFALLLFTTTLITSCSNENDLPDDNSTLGIIASNRVNICTGQEFLLACQIATSELATDFTVQWGVEGEAMTEQDSYEQGVSYKTFSFEKAGTYQIKCVARYNYGSEGVKVKEQSINILIKNAQFCGVLLGDDIETVMAKNPNMKHISLFPNAQYYSDEVSPSLTHYFFFENDELDICRTNETLALSSDSPLTLFEGQCDKYRDVTIALSRHIETDWDPATSVLYEPTEQEKLIFEKFSKKEKLSPSDEDAICALIKKRLIRLKAMMPFVDDKKVCIEIGFSSTDVDVNQFQVVIFTKYNLK